MSIGKEARQDRHVLAYEKLQELEKAADSLTELRWNIDGHPPPTDKATESVQGCGSLGDFLRDLSTDLDVLRNRIDDNVHAIREVLF